MLSTIGKVMETTMYRRLSDAAEEYGLLSEGQIDNKVARSTELTIRVVIEAIYMAWQHDVITSLLQLDIKGTFDIVNHIRFLDTLRNKGLSM